MAVPGVPTGLTSPNKTATSVDLSWTASTGTPTSYQVQFKLSSAGTYANGPSNTGGGGQQPPSYASAQGYTVLTHGSSIVMNTNWFPWTGSNASQGLVINGDGSVTDTGGHGNSYNAHVMSGKDDFSIGVWFGGGGYFELEYTYTGTAPNFGSPEAGDGWPSWWCSMPGGRDNVQLHAEVDFFEFYTGNNHQTNSGIIDWYGPNQDQLIGSREAGYNDTAELPANTDPTQRHKCGWLWIPATASTQGVSRIYFDNLPVGPVHTWSRYNGGSTPTTAGGTVPPFSELDVTHVVLLWGTGSNNPMTGYTVNVWQKNDSTNIRTGVALPSGGGPPATTATVTGLISGTSYDFRVFASNADGNSLPTSPLTVVTSAVLPGAPSNLTSTNITQTSVSLSWSAPTSGGAPTGYQMQFRASGTATWLNGPTATTTSGTVGSLTAATSYDFRVFAFNTAGNGSTSPAITRTTATAPPNLAITNITLSNNAILDNLPSGSEVGLFNVTMNDGSTFNGTLSLTGSFTNLFNIVVVPDATPVTISGITLSNTQLGANPAIGATVGAITVTMSDNSAFTGTLSVDDTAHFAISGHNLVTAAALGGTYPIQITANQTGITSVTQPFTIIVQVPQAVLPGPVTNLRVASVSPSTVILGFDPPTTGSALDTGAYTVQYKRSTAQTFTTGPVIPYVTPNIGSFTDSFGNVWTIAPTGGGQNNAVMANGVFTNGWDAVFVLMVGGVIYHINIGGEWFGFTPTGRVTGQVNWTSQGSTSPLSSVVIGSLVSQATYNFSVTVSNSQGTSPAATINATTTQTVQNTGGPFGVGNVFTTRFTSQSVFNSGQWKFSDQFDDGGDGWFSSNPQAQAMTHTQFSDHLDLNLVAMNGNRFGAPRSSQIELAGICDNVNGSGFTTTKNHYWEHTCSCDKYPGLGFFCFVLDLNDWPPNIWLPGIATTSDSVQRLKFYAQRDGVDNDYLINEGTNGWRGTDIHTYGLNWTSSVIEFYIDRVRVVNISPPTGGGTGGSGSGYQTNDPIYSKIHVQSNFYSDFCPSVNSLSGLPKSGHIYAFDIWSSKPF